MYSIKELPLEQNAGPVNSTGRVRADTEKADAQKHQDRLTAEMAETPMWSEGWNHLNCTCSHAVNFGRLGFPFKH